MKRLIAYLPIVLVLTLYVPATTADEIVKWVDENGKVHYGDKVPDQYKEQAQKVETGISIAGPEAEVRDQNKAHVDQLKSEANLKDYKERKEQQVRDKQNTADKKKKKPRSWEPQTREECRNRYVNRTAARTECFRRVDENVKRD